MSDSLDVAYDSTLLEMSDFYLPQMQLNLRKSGFHAQL